MQETATTSPSPPAYFNFSPLKTPMVLILQGGYSTHHPSAVVAFIPIKRCFLFFSSCSPAFWYFQHFRSWIIFCEFFFPPSSWSTLTTHYLLIRNSFHSAYKYSCARNLSIYKFTRTRTIFKQKPAKKSREMPLHLLHRNPDFNMRLIKEWFIYLDHQQLKVHTPNQDTEFLWMESRLISVNTSSTPGSWRDQAVSWTWLGPGLYQINFYFLLSSTASVQVAITTHHCKDGQIQLLPDFRGREET